MGEGGGKRSSDVWKQKNNHCVFLFSDKFIRIPSSRAKRIKNSRREENRVRTLREGDDDQGGHPRQPPNQRCHQRRNEQCCRKRYFGYFCTAVNTLHGKLFVNHWGSDWWTYRRSGNVLNEKRRRERRNDNGRVRQLLLGGHHIRGQVHGWMRMQRHTLSVKKKSALIIVGKNVSRYKKSRQK